ncbi:HD domain-containing protein [Marinitenerispora sediminis]|uniref:Metal-dependent phosphohydrolase n=1 Tax=Marinitenerispora sediminis TaxID=1931232 RepID=A0A368T2K0_9ACTN|nr:metal-dependent phosphohydrolase [Marinitenerispora sediminis]RCV49787.1 metal-dependent phosphohydrolase [Marinitenerispora sediminis]RCV50202.1 metal-dependent phosphohydrolase [Marinitenerispora sediminis]RCV55205.1 metal-dependent phosphohydrolase [Marinitenerispora sediminis]
MSRTRPDLFDAWRGLAGVGVESVAVGAELIARWAEPHRRYHTLDHLRATLLAVDDIAEAAADIASVRYAVWFHDAVYQGEPGADEERSARLAELLLPRCGLTRARSEEVARLVRATAEHTPEPGDSDAEVLCDADLAVLAGAPHEYESYRTAVREEYHQVAEADFRAARSRMLRALLDAPTLYRTPPAQERWEEAARANVEAEVALLDADAPYLAAP